MTISSERYLQQLRTAQSIMPDMLPPDFPYSEFQMNLSKYNEHDTWYDGTILDEELEIAGKTVKKYPVKINPIKGTCVRHVAMLFGDIADSDQVLVTPRVAPRSHEEDTDEERNKRNALEHVLLQAWYENNGRDIQIGNGLMSQRYGGCVFYVKYDPISSDKTIPISIEAPSPKFFVGIPNSSNPFDLEEAWIVKPISRIELENQNIVEEVTGAMGGISPWKDDIYWLSEHYTKRRYEVYVNSKRAARSVLMPSGKRGLIPFGPVNVLGIVPAVYIPHVRNATSFYGDNVFDAVKGIVLEMNSRVADYGDAVSADSHDIVVTRNINGQIVRKSLVPGVMQVDIGSGVNVTGQEAQPDAFSLRRSSTASTAMEKLVTEILYKQYRRDAIHPAVCDGEDEGSQRSSQTLITRMWALETHAQMERVEWTAGLNMVAKIIIRILTTNGNDLGITDEHAKMRIRQIWYPTLKRDRMDIVTEVATRLGANLSSIKHGLDMMGDIEDVEKELEQIYDEKEELSKFEQKNPFEEGGGGFQNKKVKDPESLAKPKLAKPSSTKEGD